MKIDNTNIVLAYLPGQSKDPIISKYLHNDLMSINQIKNNFIIGDLNARHRSWNCSDNNRAGNLLHNFLCNSKSFISFPDDNTYCPVSKVMRPSTIDIIITDALTPHCKPLVINDFHSDHLPVRFDITTKFNTKPHNAIPNYFQTDWSAFRQTLDDLLESGHTDSFTNTTSIDKQVDHLTRCIVSAKVDTVPIIKPTKDHLDTDTMIKLRELKLARNYYRRRFNRSFDDFDKSNYHYYRKAICRLISDHNRAKWNQSLAECTSGNHNIFKLIKSRKGAHLAPTHAADNSKLVTDSEKANELAESFGKAHRNGLSDAQPTHTKRVNKLVSSFLKSNARPFSDFDIITSQELLSLIKNLKTKKSPGLDGISNFFVKKPLVPCH